MSVNKIKRFFLLSTEERICCVYAVFWLLRVLAYVKILPYRTVIRTVRRWSSKSVFHSASNKFSADDVCRLVEKCARNLPLVLTCLPQAFAGYVLCRRRGYPVTLKIGVKNGPSDGYIAHAWIEFENKIIIGNIPDIKKYAVFDIENGLNL